MLERVRATTKQVTGRVLTRRRDQIGPTPSDTNALADAVAHRIVLETMLREPLAGKSLLEVFRDSSDPFWFWILTEGARRSSVVRSLIPAMPEPGVQLQYTGSSGDAALREAFTCYLLFREMYATHVGPIEECPALLDFGCGWGRILRFFLKDLEPSQLWAADPSEAMIEFCRSTFPGGHFEHIDPLPPGPFPDESFNLIYAYSVFSHLSEDMHHRCLTELTRILRPGGLLVATTRPRSFIQHCAAMRKHKDLSTVHAGPRRSAAAFPDPAKALGDYDAGRYCYSQLVFEGPWSYWGEAAIPQDYVAKNWTRHLAFVDYIDDRERCAQNAIVMQKPGG